MTVRVVLVWIAIKVRVGWTWLVYANRWWVVIVVSALPWMDGYRGTASELCLKVLPAVGFWWWGFDMARRGRRLALSGMMKHETERSLLFVVAVIAAVVMLAGSHHQEVARRGEEVLYLTVGLAIRRQGFRIGSKRLEWWEYADELKYGSLGDVVVMLVVASAIIATHEVVGPLGLIAVVAPMGMMAIADEPRYLEKERHVERFFIRMYRRVEMEVLDEAW